MKVVAIVSPAGKCGKTTVALALAEVLLDVLASTAVLDASTNQRAMQWANVAGQEGKLPFPVVSDVPQLVVPPQVLIVDTPADELSAWLDRVPRPDLAVVQIQPTDGGFWHIEQLMADLETEAIRAALLIVRVPPGDRTAPALRDPLDQTFGVEIFGPEIPERNELRQILEQNQPLSKVAYGTPSHQQVFRMAQGVKGLLGL